MTPSTVTTNNSRGPARAACATPPKQ
jgi:hypothetical protein